MNISFLWDNWELPLLESFSAVDHREIKPFAQCWRGHQQEGPCHGHDSAETAEQYSERLGSLGR